MVNGDCDVKVGPGEGSGRRNRIDRQVRLRGLVATERAPRHSSGFLNIHSGCQPGSGANTCATASATLPDLTRHTDSAAGRFSLAGTTGDINRLPIATAAAGSLATEGVVHEFGESLERGGAGLESVWISPASTESKTSRELR